MSDKNFMSYGDAETVLTGFASDIKGLETGKADKVSSAVSGNFAGLDGNGNLTDSGRKASDFATPSDVQDVYATMGANGAKNLLDNTYKLKKVASGSQLDGLTVTRRSDGAVVLNGTVSGSGNQGYVEVFKTTNFQFDGMILSGKNSNAITAAKLGLWDETASAGLWLETTEEANISGMNGHTVRVTLNIYGGNTFDNMVFLPMVRLATDTDSTYAPYAKTNTQLTEDTQSLTSSVQSLTSSIQDLTFYLEQTVTLSTSAATTVTFSNAKITANSLIDVAVSEWGTVPENVTVSAGSCTVTMPQAETAHSVTVRIYVR